MNEFERSNDWLAIRAAQTPAKVALLTDGRSWTFSQLDALVSRLCHFLAAGIIQPKEGNDLHIGLLASNSLANVVCIFAAARMGAILVPLNNRLTSVELAWQIEQADCSVIVCTPDLEHSIRDNQADQISIVSLPIRSSELEEQLVDFPSSYAKSPRLSLSSQQAIVFTSGTTGYPKGVMIGYANHYWGATASAIRLDMQTNDRWLACLPLYHVGGLAILFRSCLYGTSVVLHNDFNEAAVLAGLGDESVTMISLVPTMLKRLLDAGLTQAGAPTLRLILLGGAAASPGLLAASAAAGLPVVATYGSTETTSQTATMEPGHGMEKPGSVGKPLLHNAITILDDDGLETSRNEPGEIAVRGPIVMSGYYNDPVASAAKLRNGWLHTGDIGYLDDDGDLWVLDRRDDLIVSGGENVYPAEIERILGEHPAISLACVIGLPHPDWGQQVAAIIVPKNPKRFDPGAVSSFCRERLAGFKQPREFFVIEALPLTSSGKINRRAAAQLIERQQS